MVSKTSKGDRARVKLTQSVNNHTRLTCAGPAAVSASFFPAAVQRWCAKKGSGPHNPTAKSGGLLPFEGAFDPFISDIGLLLKKNLKSRLRLISIDAFEKFEQHLIQEMVTISDQVLAVEFNAYKWSLRLDGREKGGADGPVGRDIYNGFIRELLDGAWIRIFDEYPLIPQLMSVRANYWISFVEEFLRRLEADLSELQLVFSVLATDCVSDCVVGEADSHYFGRTSVRLVFESGRHIYYKPKSLALDQALGLFLMQSPDVASPFKFRTPRTLDKGEYGWMESVDQTPVKGCAEGSEFYRALGALTALIYVFQGTDFQGSNIVACGKWPYVIDAETLLHPSIMAGPQSVEEIVSGQKWLTESVLRTHMIEGGGPSNQCAPYVVGIGQPIDKNATAEFVGWKHVNSNEMKRVISREQIEGRENILIVDHQAVSADDYADDIVDGFSLSYQVLATRFQKSASKDCAVERILEQRCRVIFRSTAYYSDLIRESLHPEFLQSEEARAAFLCDRLTPKQDILGKKSRDEVYRCELLDIWFLDVPKFETIGTSTNLFSAHGHLVKGAFAECCAEQVERKLTSLGPRDLRRQVDLIRAVLGTRRRAPRGPLSGIELQAFKQEVGAGGNNDALKKAGYEISRRVRSLRLDDNNKAQNWVVMSAPYSKENWRFEAIGPNLYSGTMGVALLFAAIFKVNGSEANKEDAVNIAEGARDRVLGESLQWLEEFGIGGYTGIGSVVYGLTVVGDLTGQTSLWDDALKISRLITPEMIEADSSNDVISGCSGAASALIKLHQQTGEKRLEKQIRHCGRKLVASMVSSDVPHRAWQSLASPKPLAGFAHGAAGISLSLLRIYELTGNEKFKEAALEGINYQRALYSLADKRWKDRRYEDTYGHAGSTGNLSWCNGAAGIAMSRLSGIGLMDDELVREEIKIAVEGLSNVVDGVPINLCCGIGGFIEPLLSAGKVFGNRDLEHKGNEIAANIAKWALKKMGEQKGSIDDMIAPMFFQGYSGIAYQLLKVAAFPELPSVLTLE